jgi:hypothetical protein
VAASHVAARQAEFIAFLTHLEDEIAPPSRIIHIVCDNLPTHRGKQVRAWLERHPRFHREVEYLNKNKEHMRYAHFREQGLFIGSGVIEAACKNLVGKRLKQSGMEWTVRGANAILALRCTILSHRFNDYWDKRAA